MLVQPRLNTLIFLVSKVELMKKNSVKEEEEEEIEAVEVAAVAEATEEDTEVPKEVDSEVPKEEEEERDSNSMKMHSQLYEEPSQLK
jgi:hypothetical protein